MQSDKSTALEEPELSEPAILEELDRILGSPEFTSSPQLSLLLRHVVETTLRGKFESLKESMIALEVLNRPPDYDPKVDPIVRVEARRLRSKLSAYYSGRGILNPVRIDLPKGGYVPSFTAPVFTPQAAAVESINETLSLADDDVPPITSRRTNWAAIGVVAALVLLSGLAVARVIAWQHAAQDPVKTFWASLLDADRQCILVPADSGLVMLQNLAQRPVPLNEYMTGEYLDLQQAVNPTLASFGSRRYTSIVDLQFAAQLATRAADGGTTLQVRYARDLRLNDVKGTNLILLGARSSNPWVELYEEASTIRIEFDQIRRQSLIRNLAPEEGEAAIYRTDGTGDVYGLITYHPSPDRSGNILTIGGTTVAGTEAAADFVLNDDRMRAYLERARGTGFDLLVQSRNLAGNAPLAQVVAFHFPENKSR